MQTCVHTLFTASQKSFATRGWLINLRRMTILLPEGPLTLSPWRCFFCKATRLKGLTATHTTTAIHTLSLMVSVCCLLVQLVVHPVASQGQGLPSGQVYMIYEIYISAHWWSALMRWQRQMLRHRQRHRYIPGLMWAYEQVGVCGALKIG